MLVEEKREREGDREKKEHLYRKKEN